MYIPVARRSDHGAPHVNLTIMGTRRGDVTMPMKLSFNYRNEVGFPFVQSATVQLNTRNNVRLSLTDPGMNFFGSYGPMSVLSLRRNSWIRNMFGSIAFTGDYLVLNSSSREEFISTCFPGSNMTIGLDGSVPNTDTFVGSIFSANADELGGAAAAMIHEAGISFQLRSMSDGMIASVPRSIFSQITNKLFENGAIRDDSSPSYSLVVSNCTSNTLATLPNIVFRFGFAGDLVLSPLDYIRLVDARRVCVVNLRIPLSSSFTSPHFINPFLINGLNFRITNDFFEVCDYNSNS